MDRILKTFDIAKIAFPVGGVIKYAIGYDDCIELSVYNPDNHETVITHIYEGQKLNIRSDAFWRDKNMQPIADMKKWDLGAAKQQLSPEDYKKLLDSIRALKA